MAEVHYWDDIDSQLDSLVKHGFVKLPSLKVFNLVAIANRINIEMDGEIFVESSPSHVAFLEELELDRFLTPKLYELAKSVLGYKGEIANQYHIARRVTPVIQKKCLEHTLILISLQWYYQSRFLKLKMEAQLEI